MIFQSTADQCEFSYLSAFLSRKPTLSRSWFTPTSRTRAQPCSSSPNKSEMKNLATHGNTHWLMIWNIFFSYMGMDQYLYINTIFRGMNIHLPAILMFTRGTRFWHTAILGMSSSQFDELHHFSQGLWNTLAAYGALKRWVSRFISIR